MSHPLLENRTAFESSHGYTPDISAILHFSFWDKIYYLDSEACFPQTKEKEGHFVGFTENVGDALKYWVFDPTSQQVLAGSVVRLATTINERANTTPSVSSPPLLVGHSELTPTEPIIVFDPLDHTGYGDFDTPSSPVAHPTPSPNLPDIRLGTRISVFWPNDDQYYPGTITSITKDGIYQRYLR